MGDLVSMEVISPPGADLKGKSVQVTLDGAQGRKLGQAGFEPFGLGNRSQATLLWAWDTRGLTPGLYDLTFDVTPGGPIWTRTVTLQPANSIPLPEPQAKWASAQSKCCVFYYVTGTAAERDIRQIMSLADAQAADASQRMGVPLTSPITVTLLPRVLGNGGFTSDEISVSYLDRNYGGNEFAIVLHHEMIHALDGRLGNSFRPTMLLEGLAVYESGGHFRQQPLLADAAALLQMHTPIPPDADISIPPQPSVIFQPLATSQTALISQTANATQTPQATPTITPSATASVVLGLSSTQTTTVPLASATPGFVPAAGLGWFLPLRTLADNFYASQHEIGYLESAALIEYMVERWGWDAFNKFYRDIHSQSSGSPASAQAEAQADAINAALTAHFGITIDALQADFLSRLLKVKVTPANLSDVQETVAFFDAMQLYQYLLDPSAYFRTAWLQDNKQMRSKGIVADYLRHPSASDNVALETMLIAANQDWQANNYAGENQILAAVNAVLAEVEDQSPDPFAANSMASDYLSIVETLLNQGYQPQRITLDYNTAQGSIARAWVTASGPLLSQLELRRENGSWAVYY